MLGALTGECIRGSSPNWTWLKLNMGKEMATHSSVLAWRIPGMGEPGGLPSMGSHRVGHNWSNSSCRSWIWTAFIEVTEAARAKQDPSCKPSLGDACLSLLKVAANHWEILFEACCLLPSPFMFIFLLFLVPTLQQCTELGRKSTELW